MSATPSRFDDDDQGSDPNGPHKLPLPGDAGFTVQLEGGPLHGRDARLRDSSFRLWYVVDRLDRPTVFGRRGRPALDAGQRVVGYYALDMATEAPTWHREEPVSDPTAGRLLVPVPPPRTDWHRILRTIAALLAAYFLGLLALRPVGRYVPIGDTMVLDTRDGSNCVFKGFGMKADCSPRPYHRAP